MRPYFMLPELILLANGFLAVMRDPTQKDFDHVIPRLNDQMTRINSIMQYYSKLNDNNIVLYPRPSKSIKHCSKLVIFIA